MKNKITLLFSLCSFSLCIAQVPGQLKWTSPVNNAPGYIQAFQENKGQVINPANNWAVYYEANCGGTYVLFTPKGIIYSIPHKVQVADKEINKEGDAQKEQETKYKTIYSNVVMQWVGASSSVSIEGIGKTPYYFGSVNPTKAAGINNIQGFKEIVYHNLYPGIDVEFTFHADKGFEYSLKVKPGYDASAFKMNYSGQDGLTIDNNGNLQIKTAAGDITEYAPHTNQSGKNIASGFALVKGDEVTFNIGKINKASAFTVDPWVVTPYSGSTPTDVCMDSANNTYVLEWVGGAMYVQKFLPTGVLSWTYSLTQFLSGNSSISDIASDPSGNTYIAQPYYYANADSASYALLSLNTLGTLRYFYNTYNNSLGTVFETWDVAYSSMYHKLLEAGAPNVTQLQIGIINPATGKFNDSLYTNVSLSEIYSGAISPNGNYYGLTSNLCFCTGSHTQSLAAFNISGNSASMLWNVNVPSYDYADFAFKNPGGIAANEVAASAYAVYTSDGATLYKFNANTGALLDSTAITDGTNVLGNVNGGIAVDTCGEYIYVGTLDSVKVYDYYLHPVTGFKCPGIVYDLSCGNGVVTACGAPTSGNGFVTQFNSLACVTGINNINPATGNNFNIYPNPSTGIFTVETGVQKTEGKAMIDVYNVLGEKVYSRQYATLSPTVSINLCNQPNGVYCVRITRNGISKALNVVKQ